MALAERAELVARLSLDNRNFLANARGSGAALRGMEGSLGRIAGHANRGLRTAATNLVKIGAVATGFVALNVKSGISSLAELEDAVTSVDGAIKQMGLTGKVTGQQVATWANEIETNVQRAFDDKEITQAATTLIRFGKITEANLRPAMQVMTDLATKTGDVGSASALLAKALADPEKAAGKLARTGVVLTKETQKQITALMKAGKVGQAQALILRELEKATKGAAAASAGPYRDAMNILKDVTEDAQRALGEAFLPVLGKVADKLSTALADPKTLEQIRSFGRDLAGGFDKLLSIGGKIPWGQIGDSMRIAGAGAKALFDAFTMLPPWVQTAVITGWGLNKLTGGALGSIVGELGKGLIKGVLGINAGVVNAKAGVVNVMGGAGGAPGGALAAGAKGGIGVLGKMFLVGEAIGLVAAVIAVQDEIAAATTKQAQDIHTSLTTSLAGKPSVKDLQMKLGGIDAGIAKLSWDPITAWLYRQNIDELKAMRAEVVAELEKANKPDKSGAKPWKNTRELRKYGERTEDKRGAVDWSKFPDPKPAIDRSTQKTEELRGALVTNLRDTKSGIILGAHGDRAAIVTAIGGIKLTIPKEGKNGEDKRGSVDWSKFPKPAKVPDLKPAIDRSADKTEALRGAFAANMRDTKSAIIGGAHGDRAAIVSAIRSSRPIVNVSVNVKTTQVRINRNYQSGGNIREGAD